MVGRIDAAASDLAEPQIQAKRGLISSGIADPSSWTPEQQSAVDQSLALDKKGLIGDPATRRQAAISTGDISPKDAATMADSERRLDSADARTTANEKIAAMRDATARYKADLKEGADIRRDETANKRLEALVKGTGGTKEALSFVDGARKDIASEASQIKGLYQAELMGVFSAEKRAVIEAKYRPQFDAIEAKRRQLDSDFDSLRSRIDLPPAGTSSGKPTGPTNKTEAGMKNDVNGGMGADPAAIKREIAATEADLKKVTDPSSRAQLTAHLDDLRGKQGAPASTTAKTRPPLSSFQK